MSWLICKKNKLQGFQSSDKVDYRFPKQQERIAGLSRLKKVLKKSFFHVAL